MQLLSNSQQLLETQYSELKIKFEPEFGVLWTLVNQDNVPCVTSALLQNLMHHHEQIQKSDCKVTAEDSSYQIRYSVLASITPKVFNLGGQLSLFRTLIRDQNRAALTHYAARCIDVIFPRMRNFNDSVCTITLIQGDALGGGLEAALASDIVIAERSSQMGFPEVLFNLFPGMGAYSLVARKIGTQLAEKMMLSGKIYSAEELYEIGLIDVLAEDGEGENAVYEFIKKNERRANAFKAIQKVKQRYNPITYSELIDITEIWVDSALNLTEKDLRIMDRLVRSQEKQFVQHAQPIAA